MKPSSDAALNWNASSPEKRNLLVAFVLKGRGKPVSRSALREDARGYFGRRTFDVYLRRLVEEGVLLQTPMEGFKKKKGFVVSKTYRKYSDEVSRLLGWERLVKLFDIRLNDILSELEKKQYGRKMSKDKRNQLIIKALESAYMIYIPSQLALVRDAIFYSQHPDVPSHLALNAPLARLTLREYTDHLLNFAARLRSQVSVETMGIANDAVWGWDQMNGALPKLIGKMWFTRKKWQKQFFASEAKRRKNPTRSVPPVDLEIVNKQMTAFRSLKRLLGNLEMELQRYPTKEEYIDQLKERGFAKPEEMLEWLILSRYVLEPKPGFVTWFEDELDRPDTSAENWNVKMKKRPSHLRIRC